MAADYDDEQLAIAAKSPNSLWRTRTTVYVKSKLYATWGAVDFFRN